MYAENMNDKKIIDIVKNYILISSIKCKECIITDDVIQQH